MEALEETIKKKDINIYSSSSSHGHALSDFGFSFNATSTSSSDFLLILEHLIIWPRINPFFILLMNLTPNKYLLVMIDILVL
jgi:hypothetical protein